MSRSFARIRLTKPSFICLVSKRKHIAYDILWEEQIMGFFTELTRARMMELSGEKIAYAARAKKNH